MISIDEDTSPIELSIVIPVYRSKDSLEELLKQLIIHLNLINKSYEIILINDSSPDNSWEIICRLQQQHPEFIKIFNLTRNFGQHNAIMCGLRASSGNYVVTMDDDLQQHPSQIEILYNKIKGENKDLIYGVYERKRHVLWRNIGSNIINSFFRRIFKLNVSPSSFRIIRKSIVKSITDFDLSFIYLDGLFAWATKNIGQVVIEHSERFDRGRSGYTLGKLITLSLNLVVNFSNIPLRLIFVSGVSIAFVTFLFIFVQFFRWLFMNNYTPGYISLIMAICFFGGVQLVAIGMLGEYIGRINMSVNRKPQYLIRNFISLNSPTGANEKP